MVDYDDFIGNEQLVKDAGDIINNIKEFNENLSQSVYLQKNLSRFTDWYYDENSEKFGPKKFIGFKDMTAEKYEYLKNNPVTNSRGNFDSSITAATLELLSIPATGDKEKELTIKLKEFLKEYNAKPRMNTKIHMVK